MFRSPATRSRPLRALLSAAAPFVFASSPALLTAQAATPATAPTPVPSSEDPRIHEMVSSASVARIESDIRTLVAFGTRHTLSDTMSTTRGIGAARRWIYAEFQKIAKDCNGCLEVRYVAEIWKGDPNGRIKQDVNVVNVVAILRGRTEPNRYVVHTGDIDSRVSDVMNATSESPGANDNASGIAAILEAARLLSKHRPNASVAFVALSAEEQGLFGGEIVAKVAKAEGWRIDAVINNDMVGNTRGIDGVHENTKARVFAPGLPANTPAAELRRILTNGGELDTPSRQLARYIDTVADRYFPNLDVEIIYRLDRYGRGGHHTPFFNMGAAAVRLMEAHEDYTRQHQDLRTDKGIKYGDVLEGVDFDYAAKMTALDAATLLSLAWAPAAPDSATITGAVQPSARLRWKPSPSPDVIGYRVYWRKPSEVNWTRSRFVGNVTDFTVQNVIIDNYFFGVAAVGRNGQESLVAFPR
ncbi:MAG TPA: peptidase M28 [Gemmatimonas aurantiaca]|uniref:Peptidase M28A family protein n=2 Tax=Gemmatimonas aurantiaca TaxID=173480 RepID=C1A3L1_GEMAT|nr:M20/M25/M40 family metallo-hydrolase [Gemmatimonas aurantiaca]BAH37088.1 peptidase M28A family protein [Gemmatimonas aurantiaca T-27]HCT58879.1 peptidase M28 [Gemmatimonas aurantiaca]